MSATDPANPTVPATSRIVGVTVMTVTGADAPAFLHGQLANDVTGMPVGAARRSLYLNHRGHAIAEVMVLRRATRVFELVEEGGAADWVRAELQRHVIFDDVEVSAPAPAGLVTLQGAGAAEVLGGQEPAGEAVAELEVVGGLPVSAWARRRSEGGGFDLLVRGQGAAGEGAEALLAALAAAGAAVVDQARLDLLRVRALLAQAPQDAGEGVLPQEAGLVSGLSYRKGCYLGQEIMARIEARGNLRRGLARVKASADPRGAARADGVPAADDWRELRLDGRLVGRLGTVAQACEGFEALAVLRNDLPEGAVLASGGGVQVRVAQG